MNGSAAYFLSRPVNKGKGEMTGEAKILLDRLCQRGD